MILLKWVAKPFGWSNFEFHWELHDRDGRDHGYKARVVPGGGVGPPDLGVMQLVLGGDGDVGGAGELRGLRVYIDDYQDMDILKWCYQCIVSLSVLRSMIPCRDIAWRMDPSTWILFCRQRHTERRSRASLLNMTRDKPLHSEASADEDTWWLWKT